LLAQLASIYLGLTISLKPDTSPEKQFVSPK
jgi:hypothetical protein